MKVLLAFFLSLTVFLIFSKEVFAVSVNITQVNPTSFGQEQFLVNVDVSGANPGTNYLRIDVYKESTSNYFGETFNGSSWVSDSDGTHYFPITIGSGGTTVSSQITGRIGNPNIGDYPGQGSYKLKIRRYTSSGNSASDDSQTPVDVTITYIAPTATPTTTPTSTPTSTPTPTPTSTPIATKSPTPKPTKTPSPSPDYTPGTSGAGDSGNEDGVLGARDALATATPGPEESGEKKPFPIVAGVVIGLGVILVGGSVFWFFKIKGGGYNGVSEENPPIIS